MAGSRLLPSLGIYTMHGSHLDVFERHTDSRSLGMMDCDDIFAQGDLPVK